MGRNLDAYLCGAEPVAPLFLHGARGCDIAVVEGVMGLYDGAAGEGELASTAHVAKLLRAPVVLVVDASSQSRSVAALVHGFMSWDPEVRVGGVILNKVGSDRHEALLREALDSSGCRCWACCGGPRGWRRRRGIWGWCRSPSGALRRSRRLRPWPH